MLQGDVADIKIDLVFLLQTIARAILENKLSYHISK